MATSLLGAGLDALEAALRHEGLPRATVLDLRLVAEEVLTNVAKYGHDDRGEHWVRVRLALVAGDVALEFTDDGRPFDPLAADRSGAAGRDEGGRRSGGLGIRLVLSLVDAAEYVRRGSQNVLTLRKRVGAPPASAP